MTSRKDYIAIARAIEAERNRIRQSMDPSQHSVGMLIGTQAIAEELCRVFAQDNPRFDRRKFLDACGI